MGVPLYTMQLFGSVKPPIWGPLQWLSPVTQVHYVALCYLVVMDPAQDALQSQSVTRLDYFPALNCFNFVCIVSLFFFNAMVILYLNITSTEMWYLLSAQRHTVIISVVYQADKSLVMHKLNCAKEFPSVLQRGLEHVEEPKCLSKMLVNSWTEKL
jgi:hypothetical protein